MSKFYCAAPWRGLHINFRGDVKTCCAGDPNMLGNLNTQTIDQVLQSPKMQEIRASLQQGQMHPEYCLNCIQAERYGRSERHWHNDGNQDFIPAQASLTEHQPTIVDIRWNTTCNLSCNYCGPSCSSRWAGIMKIAHTRGVKPYYEQVCDYIEQHQSSVKEVALVGGEPLLLKENERLLDVIPADCIVTLITNMNVEFDSNAIVKKLTQRKRVGWSMSLDNVTARFEYVRSGGNWNLTNQNIQQVVDYMKTLGHWGGIHAVYNMYNCTHLCELREYANAVDTTILWQTLYQPTYLDPMLHSEQVRTLALAELELYQQRYGFTEQEQQFFTAVQKNLKNPPNSNLLVASEFKQHILDIETKYHKQDLGRFQQLWSEFNNV